MLYSGDSGAENCPSCALAAGNAGKTVWNKDVPCSGERYVRLAQRPLAGTKSCAAVLSDVPGRFCVRAEHDASGRGPFWVGMRNADYRALLRALKIPRAFCSQKRSALQSPLQCAAIAHAACCVATCSVLRGGFPPASLDEKRLLRAERECAGQVPPGRILPQKKPSSCLSNAGGGKRACSLGCMLMPPALGAGCFPAALGGLSAGRALVVRRRRGRVRAVRGRLRL